MEKNEVVVVLDEGSDGAGPEVFCCNLVFGLYRK